MSASQQPEFLKMKGLPTNHIFNNPMNWNGKNLEVLVQTGFSSDPNTNKDPREIRFSFLAYPSRCISLRMAAGHLLKQLRTSHKSTPEMRQAFVTKNFHVLGGLSKQLMVFLEACNDGSDAIELILIKDGGATTTKDLILLVRCYECLVPLLQLQFSHALDFSVIPASIVSYYRSIFGPNMTWGLMVPADEDPCLGALLAHVCAQSGVEITNSEEGARRYGLGYVSFDTEEEDMNKMDLVTVTPKYSRDMKLYYWQLSKAVYGQSQELSDDTIAEITEKLPLWIGSYFPVRSSADDLYNIHLKECVIQYLVALVATLDSGMTFKGLMVENDHVSLLPICFRLCNEARRLPEKFVAITIGASFGTAAEVYSLIEAGRAYMDFTTILLSKEVLSDGLVKSVSHVRGDPIPAWLTVPSAFASKRFRLRDKNAVVYVDVLAGPEEPLPCPFTDVKLLDGKKLKIEFPHCVEALMQPADYEQNPGTPILDNNTIFHPDFKVGVSWDLHVWSQKQCSEV